jgi:LacI family transcriptional regulator
MATIKDVARLAGVGVGTVSRYLSGNGSLSSQSGEKVARAMKELNYRPNSIARSLSSKKSNLIGLWVPSFSGSFHRQLLQTIEREMRSNGKHIILANAEGCQTIDQQIECLNYLIERDCDGILMSCPELPLVELVKLNSKFEHLSFINREVEGLESHSFSIDHYLGGQLAAQHLVEQGHTNIAVITGRLGAQDAQLRHQGFVDYLAKANIQFASNLIKNGGFSFEQGFEAAQSLLAEKCRFSAVFCGNDNSAMAAISALSQAGISVGNDVAVVGYDDIDFAHYTTPPLTSVRSPLDDMAINACRFLMNQCYGAQHTIEHSFAPTLTVRQSSDFNFGCSRG